MSRDKYGKEPATASDQAGNERTPDAQTSRRRFRRDVAIAIPPGDRGRWFIMLLGAFLISVLEALSAALLYSLIAALFEPSRARLPILGQLESFLPGSTDAEVRAYFAGVVALVFLVKGALYLAQIYFQQRIVHTTGVSLSSRLLRAYLSMPYVTHLQRNSAELIRNVHHSVDQIVHSTLVPGVTLVTESLLVLGVATVVIVVAPLMSLLSVIAIGLMVTLLVKATKGPLAALGHENQSEFKSTLQFLHQALEGIREIKIQGSDDFFVGRFHQSRTNLARTNYLRITWLEVPRVAAETMLVIAVLVLASINLLVSPAKLDSLALVALFGYAALRVLPSLNRIVANINNMRYGSAALMAVTDDIWIAESKPSNREDRSSPLRFTKDLVFDAVSFRYPGQANYALENVNLKIERGQSVGIVGTTGSGKTTLVDLIAGILEPTSGDLRVDGIPLSTSVKSWHSMIAMVPQFVFLIDDTIRHNIALGVEDVDIDEDFLLQVASTVRLTDFLDSLPLGLDTVIGERGVRLSGGQRQRMAIARALYRRPALLILDEATSALDNATEKAVMHGIESLVGEVTLIAVAHRLSTLQTFDRLIAIESGQIAGFGTFEEIAPRYTAAAGQEIAAEEPERMDSN